MRSDAYVLCVLTSLHHTNFQNIAIKNYAPSTFLPRHAFRAHFQIVKMCAFAVAHPVQRSSCCLAVNVCRLYGPRRFVWRANAVRRSIVPMSSVSGSPALHYNSMATAAAAKGNRSSKNGGMYLRCRHLLPCIPVFVIRSSFESYSDGP